MLDSQHYFPVQGVNKYFGRTVHCTKGHVNFYHSCTVVREIKVSKCAVFNEYSTRLAWTAMYLLCRRVPVFRSALFPLPHFKIQKEKWKNQIEAKKAGKNWGMVVCVLTVPRWLGAGQTERIYKLRCSLAVPCTSWHLNFHHNCSWPVTPFLSPLNCSTFFT